MTEASNASLNDFHTASVSTAFNRDIWSVTPHKYFFMPATRSSLPSLPKADSCVVVWSKDALQNQNQATAPYREYRLPQNTPCSERTADRVQNKLNPFEMLTSKIKIPRRVFHPNEALRLQRYETYNAATPSWNMNYSEPRDYVDQRGGNTFSPQLSTATAASNLPPCFPVSPVNFAAPFSPFFAAKPPLVMPWQCTPHQTPASESTRDWTNDTGMFNSFFSTGMRPQATPIARGGIGYQSPMPFIPRATVPQYPDVQYMFRAANLLMMPNHVTQETKSPVFEEAARKLIYVPSLEEKIPRQGHTEVTKKAVSKSLPQRKVLKSYQCSFCHKMYSRNSSLKIHMRIHTGEKPYSCKLCERSFAQAGGLESHMRSHTGEKPFKCDICDRRFSHSNAVRNHKRTHTGEKPFKCEHDGCGKGFADQSTLKKHHRIHTGEKPFQCTHCLRKFTQLGNMNKHIRCKHGKVIKK